MAKPPSKRPGIRWSRSERQTAGTEFSERVETPALDAPITKSDTGVGGPSREKRSRGDPSQLDSGWTV